VYPPEDLKARIRGLVAMQVLVSERGVPLDIVVVERARGHLTEAAVTAVRRWRFEPATKNGEPVRAWTTVRIPFEAIPFPTAAPSATLTPPPG
jgi:TonB family protein